MRLLVVTQKIDINDVNLGFFGGWLSRIAKQVDGLIVICLEQGDIGQPPQNVKILSLGKEAEGHYRLRVFCRFYRYIVQYRHDYDGVFVHMNTEYVLLGGWFWRLWNKKILLWYTHKSITWQLRLAEKLVTKIFTASKESFRLKSKKVEVVGHGINIDRFFSVIGNMSPPPLTKELRLLFVGRIAPVKDLETIIYALAELHKQKNLPEVTLSIVGAPIMPKDKRYSSYIKKLVQDLGLSFGVNFKEGVPYQDVWKEYQRHHILIHTSRTGSVDKVVLEALASGRLVITSSEAFADLAKEGLIYAFPAGDYKSLANKIEEIYKSGALDKIPDQRAIDYVRKNHNLENLIKKIVHFYAA